MQGSKLLSTLFYEFPPCQKLYVFKAPEFYIVFGVVSKSIYVAKLSHDEVTKTDISRKKYEGEAIEHDRIIMGILEFGMKYYMIDQLGSLFTISEDVGNESGVDYDIFEDSPEKQDKWALKDRKDILNGQEVKSFCFTDTQLGLLVNSLEKLSLEIIDFHEDFQIVKSITIRSPGITAEKKHYNLLWMPAGESIKEFVKNWFLSFKGNDGLFVVSMPEGNILAIDPNATSSEFLYTWPFPALISHWTPFEEGSSDGTLVFVTEGNCVVKLSQFGEVTNEFLPIDDNAKAALIKKDLLYVSDWSHTVKFYTNDSGPKSVALSVKGVLCFGSCGKDTTLALSKNGELYIVYDTYLPPENEVILPESSLTALLMEETVKLEKVNKDLLECDSYIAAINLAIKKIPFSITAQVIYARKLNYTICVSLRCLQDGITIQKKDGWNLFLSLTAGPDVITLSHKMRTDLTGGNVLTDVFSFSAQQPIADLYVRAKLIYNSIPKFAKFIPAINIGEVFLDPSYFLQPAIEVELSEVESHPSLEKILEKGSDSEMEKQDIAESEIGKKKEIKIIVEYRDTLVGGTIFKWLLDHSKPLWRSSLWSSCSETKKLEVAILGHVVALEDCGSHMVISGKDIHSCYALKRALLSSLPGAKELSLPVESMKQLEIFERTADLYLHESPSIEELEKLRENFRKSISSHLKA
ncbi:unnamed protein product [Nezara viridula]|uniref:Uncharacterized protein n=1 Tax=Nezara viridula TaxID=85310 RepID=A0A9P0MSB3_NEZVI|nr:unnamed protein product [Nezara viridula]